jgi:hypothetical protein
LVAHFSKGSSYLFESLSLGLDALMKIVRGKSVHRGISKGN